MLLSILINKLLSTLFRTELTDLTSGFIVLRKDFIDPKVFEKKEYGEYFIYLIASLIKKDISIMEVGYICETDTFANNRRINEITEGDILAFKNAGAYCFTMASNYNSRYRPAEVLWYNETAHQIRKREGFEDLTKNQILIDF